MKNIFPYFPHLTINEQVRLQLGILPLVDVCLALFLYYLYPEFMRKKAIYIISILLGLLFLSMGFTTR